MTGCSTTGLIWPFRKGTENLEGMPRKRLYPWCTIYDAVSILLDKI